MRKVATSIKEWLQTKFDCHENGIIIDCQDFTSFHLIHDFLEAKEHSFKTHAIYYNAFATDSTVEFINTLLEELNSKLGLNRAKSCLTLTEKIAAAELKMVIIDRSYLHSTETTKRLMTWLNQYGVCLILVGSEAKMNRVQFLNRPYLMPLDRYVDNAACCATAAG